MDQLDQETIKLLAASKDPYLRVLAGIALLRAKKSADYNDHGVALEDYFPFGFISYVQMIWVKVLRVRSLVNEDAVNNESVDDSLRDLVNYAIFALMRNHE